LFLILLGDDDALGVANDAIRVVFVLLADELFIVVECLCLGDDDDADRGEMVCEKSLRGVLKALLLVISLVAVVGFRRFANGGGVVADADADAADADGAADTAEAEVE